MTATFLVTYAPPNALLMWTDGKSIYIELSSTDGNPPYILNFPQNTLGLGKALALLCKHADFQGTSLTPARPVKRVGTEAQHAMAESILRKQGIIK